MNRLSSIFSGTLGFIIHHKISLTISLFIVYMLFFDEYNLRTRIKVAQTNHKLIEQKESFQKLIEMTKQDKLDLEMNYEKFAREKFKMSKADEDIFVIETKNLKQN